MFFSDRVDSFTATEGLRRTGGVLAARDGIEDEWLAGTVMRGGVPVR